MRQAALLGVFPDSKNIQGRVMKTGKETSLYGQTEKKRQGKTVFLLILLVIVSLFLGILPTLSFGNPFQVAADINPPNQSGSAFGMEAPSAPGNPNGFSQPPTSPTFSSSHPTAPAMMPPKPANVSNIPASVPMPAPAAINSAMSSSAPPAPVMHPTTNPALGGPAPIGQPHRPVAENTSPQSAPKTAKTQLPVQEKVVKSPVQTTTTHLVTSEPSYEQLKQTPNLLRSIADPKHPFAGYFESPKVPISQIKGESLSVAQLLEGVGGPQSRSRLLEKYWELTGLMVQYNVRMDSERFIRQMLDRTGVDRNLMSSALVFAQQRCRAVELEFSKTQLQLAELLKQTKGMSFSDENLPIPCDYPIYKKYETYLDRIALTEKAKYLGRMIPIQEQLIGTQRAGCEAAAAMLQNSIQSNSRDLVFYLDQRTAAFCDMINAVIDYNKQIAEYTSETVGSGVSQYRLIGAVIELPNFTSTIRQTQENDQPIQTATPIPNHFGSISPKFKGDSDISVSRNAIDLASYVPSAEQSPTVQEPVFAPSTINPTYADGPAQLPPPQPLQTAPEFQPTDQSENREPLKLGKTEQHAELGKNPGFVGQHSNHDFMPESGMPKSRANELQTAAPAGINMPQPTENETKEIQPVSFIQESEPNPIK